MPKNPAKELIWAAGFFDGEGCTYLRKSVKGRGNIFGRPFVSVGQSGYECPYVLKRFHRAVGGLGHIRGPYFPKAENRKPVWKWLTHTPYESVKVIKLLWPELSPVKKTQAKEAFLKHIEGRKLIEERKKYCKKGLHGPESSYIRKDGHRVCLACQIRAM